MCALAPASLLAGARGQAVRQAHVDHRQGRSSSAWLDCRSISLAKAGFSAPSGSMMSAPFFSRRFQRRSPTRTAASTWDFSSGRPSSASSSGAAAAVPPAPTTSGNSPKAATSSLATTWPSRSISTNLPWFCQMAKGVRSVRLTTMVPGRRRSTAAYLTQDRRLDPLAGLLQGEAEHRVAATHAEGGVQQRARACGCGPRRRCPGRACWWR